MPRERRPLRIAFDQADEPDYLCLTGYQKKDNLVATLLKKSVQLIRG